MNITEAFQKVVVWLLISSSNPNEVSLTIKGVLLGLVPAAMTLFGAAHVVVGIPIIDSQIVIDIINTAVGTLQAVLIAISAGVALLGAFRKLWNTVFAKPSLQM